MIAGSQKGADIALSPHEPPRAVAAAKSSGAQGSAKRTAASAGAARSAAGAPRAATRTAAARPRGQTRNSLELELTGATSTASDLAFARVRLEQANAVRAWTLRTGYTLSASKTYRASGEVLDNPVSTFLLDTRYVNNHGSTFTFAGAGANLRFRDEDTRRYPKRSGYVLLNGGIGQKLNAVTEGDIGLGLISVYDDDGQQVDPALTSRLRARVPFGARLTLDAQATGMLPFSQGFKVDSDTTLNYRLTEGLFMRLGFSANNLVIPVRGAGDWDLTTRLSLLYKR